MDRPTPQMVAPMFEYLLRLGDDRLILGHRLSEWCGHGPILEEDIALTNIALDLIGQASSFLHQAGEIEGQGRDEDRLAYFRDSMEYRNVHLVELPRGDFAHTIMRQFLFSMYSVVLLEHLAKSSYLPLAELSTKALVESRYHLRHSHEWVLRLGDGTEESHARTQKALNDMWMFTAELFSSDEVDQKLYEQGAAPELSALQTRWLNEVGIVLKSATLDMPSNDCYMAHGGRRGIHSEHLGLLLAEMQVLPRSYPDARW